MELGNFGDHKFCRDGVWEMRIDVGPGIQSLLRHSRNSGQYCCSAAATSEPRMRTSTAPVNTGETGKGGQSDEGQNPR